MNKYQYIIGGLFLLLTGISSCSTEEVYTQEVKEGDVPILLQGTLPQAAGDCGEAETLKYKGVYLSAKVVNSENQEVYFFKDKPFKDDMELPAHATGTANDIPLQSPLYYPLGKKDIHLFGHSGKLDSNDNLILKAGQKGENDYIICNGDDKNAGKGTTSSSNSTSTILTFRHIMTKVYVDVVVDSDPNDKPDPKPESIDITLTTNLAALDGSYAINSKPTDKASGTGDYHLKAGINYLIPNGAILADETNPIKPITGLKIDDYTAGNECKDLVFKPAADNLNKKIELLSGHAYKLTFNVKRLKVTSITFTKIPWDIVLLGNENSSYIPAKLNLDLGSYSQTVPNDTITKVVLHTNDNKQYVGNIIYDNTHKPIGQFVSLPETTTAPTVDLYTSQGLLIAGVTPQSYIDNVTDNTNKDLTITLSPGGMKTANGQECTETNPYLVETPLQFRNLSKEAARTFFKQEKDLDLVSSHSDFTPIETFDGTFDGNGMRILNATFKGNGLFTSNSGTIKNIRIASGKITATGTHSGSICGINTETGTVVACINEAQIHGTATHAGGICGKNNGAIIACLNTGDIFTGSTYSGGICGENTSTTSGAITACVNVGMMNRASSNMAGICGTSTGTGILKTCYWLTGTAKKYSGNDVLVNDTEVAVNNGYTPADSDVANLSPQKLRNDKGGEESSTTTELLNTAITSPWNTYKFTYDVKANGCVWPMPVKSNP